MPRQVRRLARGTAAEVAAYTGPTAEPIVNTETWRLHVQDGATAGGRPLALLSEIFGTNISSPEFGALGNDSANCTAAINSAVAAASTAGGGAVLIPRGIFRVTALDPIPPNVVLVGESRSKSILRTTSATADVITLDGSRAGVENLTIDASVTRTAGSFIRATTNCSRVFISRVDMQGPFIGITIPSIALAALVDIDIADTVVSTGRSIEILGGYVIYLHKVVCRLSSYAGTRPYAHLNIKHVEDVTITDSWLLGATHNMNVEPDSGQAVGLIRSQGTQYDYASAASIRIAPAAGGAVNEVVIDSPWIKGVGEDVLITDAGGGTVGSVQLNSCLLTGTDVGVSATGVANMMITDCMIGSHTVGVAFDNVQGGSIKGGVIGPHGLYAGNGTGIVLAGSTDNVFIGAGLNLSGNTTVLNNVSSGTANVITGVMGYPPSAAQFIPVGASPFTYTAGPTPETVFVNGGTVSLIAVNGTGMLEDSNHAIALSPNHSLTVTYSSAPSMVSTRAQA